MHRAALLTGRTNERSCIHSALRCDQENPAPGCAMGRGIPHSEFTIADAVHKSPHNYASIMIGKCQLQARTRFPPCGTFTRINALIDSRQVQCHRLLNYAFTNSGHLGDLFAKPGVRGYEVTTNAGTMGFEVGWPWCPLKVTMAHLDRLNDFLILQDWMLTEAEASSSMSNCGCFPVNHTNPGPKPPSGYSKISPNGDHCVVGGGYESDW